MNRPELNTLNWDSLVILDPYLNTVLREIQELQVKKGVSMRQNWKRYREIMVHRVGFCAPDDSPAILKTSKAYDITYEKLYNALGYKYNYPFQPMIRDEESYIDCNALQR